MSAFYDTISKIIGGIKCKNLIGMDENAMAGCLKKMNLNQKWGQIFIIFGCLMARN